MPRGPKVPLPGAYSGTVDGMPAIFVVGADFVSAYWSVLRAGMMNGHVPRSDTWDVRAGRFEPFAYVVHINTKSRRTEG
jgi:hypothetical protein